LQRLVDKPLNSGLWHKKPLLSQHLQASGSLQWAFVVMSVIWRNCKKAATVRAVIAINIAAVSKPAIAHFVLGLNPMFRAL
jgi:hypothetical protein